jgi:serine protease Do
MSKMKRTFAVLALGGVGTASWFVGSGLVQNVQYARAVEQVEVAREQLARAEDLAGVFRTVGKAVEPSVVYIQVTKKEVVADRMGELRRMIPDDDMLRRFFPDNDGDGEPDLPEGFGGGGNGREPNIMQGQGSGVIMEADGSTGWVLTNNHVAGNADEIVVTLADGREIRNAKLVGADPKTDLAVIRIDADRLIAAPWGDSTKMVKGDFVLAFGAPFGMVGSMTHGIVSGFNRQTGILGQFGYEDFLQTDCPINPGNSGGPLVNLRGEVIGINSAILTKTGAFQGVGFAIPANQAKNIYQTLKESGRVTRGYLGVQIFDGGKARDLAKTMGIEREGVVVSRVETDSPSLDKLEPADVITKIDGKEVKTVQELRSIVASTKPGTKSTFTVLRDGKEQDVQIEIGEQPDSSVALNRGGNDAAERNREKPSDRGGSTTAEKLGMRLTDPTPELLDRYGLDGDAQGALVTKVEQNSPAFNGGIRAGDVITKIGDKEVASSDEAMDALAAADPEDGVRLHIASKEGKRFAFIPKQAK